MSPAEQIEYIIFLRRDCNLDTSIIIQSLAVMGLTSAAIANAINSAIKVMQ